MQSTNTNLKELLNSSKRFARRLITIGENRLELLMVELQEERSHLLHAFLLAIGIGLCSTLALVAFSATLVVLLWDFSPLSVLLSLTALYVVGALCLYYKLTKMLRSWKPLPATLDQLKKDRTCLTQNIE